MQINLYINIGSDIGDYEIHKNLKPVRNVSIYGDVVK